MERDQATDWPNRIALYGPLLLALYFVSTTRWGSFMLPGPPYIGDWVLGALIAQRLWLMIKGRLPELVISHWLGVVTIGLILLSLARLATGELTTDALRDSAPYLYAVLVLFGQSYRQLGEDLARRLVEGALMIHAAWFTVSELSPSVASVATPGDSTVFLLEQRPDIDGAFLAALMGLGLDRVVMGRNPLLGAALSGWALALVLSLQSRASFLSAAAVIAFMALRWLMLWRSSRRKAGEPVRRRIPTAARIGQATILVLAVPVVMTIANGPPAAIDRSLNAGKVAVGADAPRSAPPAPVLPSGEPVPPEQGGSNGGKGDGAEPSAPAPTVTDTGTETFKARLAGWEEVVEWMYDGGASRMIAGVGFGRHYMQESGADVAFLGPAADPSVRAVHNIGLNTWARLGIVGLIGLFAIGALAIAAALRLSTRASDPPTLDLFASLLVVAIPVVALLGVVLESPFGAIPYFWAVSYLGMRMVEEGHWRPARLPDWLNRRQAA